MLFMEYELVLVQASAFPDPIDLILGRLAAYPSEPVPSLKLPVSALTSPPFFCSSSECGNYFILINHHLYHHQQLFIENLLCPRLSTRSIPDGQVRP